MSQFLILDSSRRVVALHRWGTQENAPTVWPIDPPMGGYAMLVDGESAETIANFIRGGKPVTVNTDGSVIVNGEVVDIITEENLRSV